MLSFIDRKNKYMHHIFSGEQIDATFYKLKDICDIDHGTVKINHENSGDYNNYSGCDSSLKSTTFNREGCHVIVSKYCTPPCDIVRIVNEKFFLDHCGMTLEPNDSVNKRYLGYYLYYNQSAISKCCDTAGVMVELDVNKFSNLDIPVPTLEIQTEIAKSIAISHDNMQNLKLHIRKFEKDIGEYMQSIGINSPPKESCTSLKRNLHGEREEERNNKKRQRT